MAKWVEVTQKFDWRETMRHMRTFAPGNHLMTDAQAEDMVRRGAGKVLEDRPEDAPKTPKAKPVK